MYNTCQIKISFLPNYTRNIALSCKFVCTSASFHPSFILIAFIHNVFSYFNYTIYMYTELDGLKYGFFDYFNTGIIFCDVLYECMLNSTEKLQINKFLSYLKRVPGGGGHCFRLI